MYKHIGKFLIYCCFLCSFPLFSSVLSLSCLNGTSMLATLMIVFVKLGKLIITAMGNQATTQQINHPAALLKARRATQI